MPIPAVSPSRLSARAQPFVPSPKFSSGTLLPQGASFYFPPDENSADTASVGSPLEEDVNACGFMNVDELLFDPEECKEKLMSIVFDIGTTLRVQMSAKGFSAEDINMSLDVLFTEFRQNRFADGMLILKMLMLLTELEAHEGIGSAS